MKRLFTGPVKAGLIIITLLWAGVGLAVWLNSRQVAQALPVGRAAPAFILPDQTGRAHKLSDYRGRAVALVFFDPADVFAVGQMRSLNRAMPQFDALGVKVFGIAAQSVLTAKRLHDDEKLEFPLLVDDGGRVAALYGARHAGGRARRLSYVVGPDGKVLLPVLNVQPAQHGAQLVELTECCLDKTTRAGSRLIGTRIPDFRLPRATDGAADTLYGKRRGKAIVLFFLSARCPCSAHYDARNRDLALAYAPKGVRFIGVYSSEDEGPNEIAAHKRRAGSPFPVLRDAGNLIADRFGAQVTPEVFVMDARGLLRYHGRIDDSRDPAKVRANDLRNALDFLLAGRVPPRAEMAAFGCAIARARKVEAR